MSRLSATPERAAAQAVRAVCRAFAHLARHPTGVLAVPDTGVMKMPTDAVQPTRLGAKGKLLWKQITTSYELRPDEVRVLEDACREADLIERLERELQDSPLMVKGSQGQLVASPLVTEVRQHRATLTTMLKALKLPDTDAGAARRAEVESEQARAAARARWDRRRAQ